MSGRPWLPAAIGAALDVVLAALFFALDYTWIGVLMIGVAALSVVMAFITWRRLR